MQSQNTVGLLNYSDMSNEGYTLFSPVNSNSSYLIDNCGFLINSWDSEFRPGLMAYLLEDGSLLRSGRLQTDFIAGGSGGRVEKISWDNELLWAYDFATEDQQSHHDIAPLPNGNFLILLWDKHIQTEIVAMGRDTNFIPSNTFLWSEKVLEVKPIGIDQIEVVWEWNSWDHLVQDYDPEKNNFGTVSEHPERFNINFPFQNRSTDWMHMNAIDYNPELDQIVLNSRNFHEFYIIDHSTSTEEAKSSSGGTYEKGGDILFRWGNPQAYNKGTEEDRKLYGQHDASWIQADFPGEGNILVFNNGIGSATVGFDASRIEEIFLDQSLLGFYNLNENGTFGPEAVLWTYPEELNSNFSSGRIAGAQRLRNGTTLICEGETGRLFEVDELENILWEYLNPVNFGGPIVQGSPPSGSDIFKVRRYEYDYPAFEDKVLQPLAPIELSPSPTDCITTNIKQVSKPIDVALSPNPFYNDINIKLPEDQYYVVEIFNQLGQRLSCNKLKGSSIINIDVDPKGIYYIKILDVSTNVVYSQTMIKL